MATATAASAAVCTPPPPLPHFTPFISAFIARKAADTRKREHLPFPSCSPSLHKSDASPFRKSHPCSALSLEYDLQLQERGGEEHDDWRAAESVLEAAGEEVLEEAPKLSENANYPPPYQSVPLRLCIEANSVSAVRILHAHIAKTVNRNLFFLTFLVTAYSKCGSLKDAQKLFDKLPHQNIVSWTALITGHTRISQPEQAATVFVQSLLLGFPPTSYSLSGVLSACASLHSPDLGKQIHGQAIKCSLLPQMVVSNSLLSFYSKHGDFESAVKVLKSLCEKNVISWTTIISMTGDHGQPEMGRRFFVDMLMEGVTPTEFTLSSVISLCLSPEDFPLGKQIQSMCIKFGYMSNEYIMNVIMKMYLRRLQTSEAHKLLFDLQPVHVGLWNSLIHHHARLTKFAVRGVSSLRGGVKAFEVFMGMDRCCVKPDFLSYSNMLTICSDLAALDQGEQLHARVIKAGFARDHVIGVTLLNMYSKCGSVEKASKTFVEMPMKNLISWTSMISGYAQHGLSEQAILLFEDMRLAGVRPNQVTFVAVLSACSHAGLVAKAEYYFRMMEEEYQINPIVDHYVCMVSMYVRFGKLVKAFDYVNSITIQPDEVLWSILLAGCRSHGKIELGCQVVDQLLELKPQNHETYYFILNFYISAQKWDDVSRVKKLMKTEKIGSKVDWSWISIRDRTYSFREDDRSFTKSVQMQDFLSNLLERAKDLGYVPLHSIEVIEDGTGNSSGHHSEKLAVAFGLMSTADGAPIRVVKTTRVCGDCHNAIKYFSMLSGREIIVRDRRRMHIFKEGRCSSCDFAAYE